MKKFWRATLIPGLCCILAGVVLAMILALGYADELMEYRGEFSINEDNFWEYFGVDKYVSMTRDGAHYDKNDTTESFYYAVPEEAEITGIGFEFAVGEVEIRTGNVMEVTVTDMFENAISSKVDDGVWYITDSLLGSGSVHGNYSPEIIITIPDGTLLEFADIYLAAGMLDADELTAKDVLLEVDAGSMQVFYLEAENSLTIKNGVGEIRGYSVDAKNLRVNNGVGAVSLTGAISGNNTIECGIGEVKLSLTDRNSVDFNYSVDCGIGEVEIGNKNYTGSVENMMYDRLHADYFELNCGIGHIEIKVNGN